MAAQGNYWLAWLVYFLASGLFYSIFWWLTRSRRGLWIAYSLRGLMAALILTPWYANDQGSTMAPALIVLLLDAITIGGSAVSRAAVPLLLAILVGQFLATICWLLNKRLKKSRKNS